MKKRKMLILAIASALIIGGTIVAVQNKDLFGGIAQQKYQSAEEKQLAYLKEHEEEIKEFVKSQNPRLKRFRLIGMKPSGKKLETALRKVEEKL
mgnify:CR=1 FL=1